MSDEKKRVNIEDLPVPLKDLDKEEEDHVTGGIGGLNPTNPSPGTLNPTNPAPIDSTKNPTAVNPLNPTSKNPTFNP
jgi:hypothetical protein